MADPLVFLTSTSSSAPSGRNARATARASMVRSTTHSVPGRGTFNVFSATHGQDTKKILQKSILLGPFSGQKRQCSCSPEWNHLEKQCAGSVPRVLGPQSITIEELLATATTKIRHDLTLVLRKQPSRVRDVFRCKQWAAAAFASGTLLLTPEVHSAVKYLEHKVLSTHHSGNQSEIGLQKYGLALSELQQSLRDPQRRMQLSVLAASHILAICEMIGDTTSGNYLKFAGGIVSLSSLHARKGGHHAELYDCSNAGAILVEALLTKRSDARLDQSWSQTLVSAGDQGFLPREAAFSSADGADLILSQLSSTNIPLASQSTNENKIILKARARRLHSTLKQSIQSSLLQSNRPNYACPIFGTISGQIAVMLGLDDFISQITGGSDDSSELVHGENDKFYADVISVI